MRRMLLAVLALALIALVWFAMPKPARSADARLFYEIVVTAPGTRSQGWHGVLYDRGGQPVQMQPGMSVQTNAGEFVNVACSTLWTPCGFIHADQLRWMQTNGGNFILGSRPWVYRLFVAAECTRSEGWRGEILQGGRAPAGRRLRTPLGPFVRKASSNPWGQNGWFHQAWPSPAIGPGHWPC